MKMFRYLLCCFFGHSVFVEYEGGCSGIARERCRRCSWIGRHAEYDPEMQGPWQE